MLKELRIKKVTLVCFDLRSFGTELKVCLPKESRVTKFLDHLSEMIGSTYATGLRSIDDVFGEFQDILIAYFTRLLPFEVQAVLRKRNLPGLIKR